MANTQELVNITEETPQLSPSSVAYVSTLAQPYVDALTAATTIESVLEWLPAVVPEKAADVIPSLEGVSDVEVAKTFAVEWIKSLITQYAQENVGVSNDKLTPWDLAVNRDEMLTRLFGPASDELPITVVIGPNSYVHNMTEELAYGLVVSLQDHPEIGIFSDGVPLTSDVFDYKYQDIPAKYSVTINGKHYRFNTPNFIHGVKTAAEWTNRKSSDVASNLMEGETSLNFN